MITTYAVVGEAAGGADSLDDMPPGSAIGNTGSDQFIKLDTGLWQRINRRGVAGDTYRANQFAGGNYRVISLPEGTVYQPRPAETVERYMNRFRGKSLQKAIEHGVSYSASQSTLDQMGAKRDVIPLGPGVPVFDSTERESLPVGTIVYVGKPDQVATFGVFEKRPRAWQRVLGEMQHITNDQAAVIHTMNGSQEPVSWMLREPTDEDKVKIAEFRAGAWRHGWQLKQSQSWCGTYESVMRDLGLTSTALHERSVDGITAGDVVSPEVAACLPVGSVLAWRSTNHPEEFGCFVRTNTADNIARTVRVSGASRANRNYRSAMRVVSIAAEGDLAWRMGAFDQEFFGACAPGTVFSIDESTARYVKCQDGTYASNDGQNTPNPERMNRPGQYQLTTFANYSNVVIYNYGGITL